MTLLYIIVAILLFGLLVVIHELGHFTAAKLCGVRVEEFAVGMGPALWKKQKGETLYALRAIPVGGYCAMTGEDGESDDPRAFGNQKAWKRFIVIDLPTEASATTRASTSRLWLFSALAIAEARTLRASTAMAFFENARMFIASSAL